MVFTGIRDTLLLAWQCRGKPQRRPGQPSCSWVGWKHWTALSLPLAEVGPHWGEIKGQALDLVPDIECPTYRTQEL